MSGRQFLIIVTITFLTVVIWVVSDILHARSKVTIPPETLQLIEPISPEFDTGALSD